MTSHTHTIHGAGIFHYIYHLKTTTIHGSLNIQIVPMVPWIRRHRPLPSLLSTKPSTAHKASVSAGMARLKAAALDKSARYFPWQVRIGRRFFLFFSPKTNEEFVRTPDFLWKIHATGRFESKPIFQIKWSLGFWRHVTFSGVKLFGGGGL